MNSHLYLELGGESRTQGREKPSDGGIRMTSFFHQLTVITDRAFIANGQVVVQMQNEGGEEPLPRFEL